MDILDVFKMLTSYKARIQVCYFPDGYGSNPHKKEDRSQIMYLKNVTYKHIDHWRFRKEVWKVIPCVDKQGNPYMFIQLRDVRKEDYK